MPDMPNMPDAPVKRAVAAGAIEYIVQGQLAHDGTLYHDGDAFRCDDAAVIATLRAAGALALPNELQSPEDVAVARARLEAENADLQAQIEALRAQVEAGQADAASDGGKGKSKSS